MKKLGQCIILCVIVCKMSTAKAQKSDLEVGLYNIGINSLIGGIGAAINKNKREPIGKVVLKGIGQGAMGGYLIFESKRLVREFSETENFAFIWPSKLVNAAGVSVVENAAVNRNFWEKWHLTIGFNRLELHTVDEFKLSYRIMPIALVGTLISSTQGNLDIEKTLKTGAFIFSTDKIPSENGFTFGRTFMFGNSILLLDTWEGEKALPHEIVHNYQNENFSAFNSYYEKPLNYLVRDDKFRWYNKIFYTDLNPFILYLSYNVAGNGENGYNNNIFEKEAFYFTEKEFINPNPPTLFQKH